MKIKPFRSGWWHDFYLGIYFSWQDRHIGEYELGVLLGPLIFGLKIYLGESDYIEGVTNG